MKIYFLAMLHKLETIQTDVGKKSTEKAKNNQRQTKTAAKRRRRECISFILLCACKFGALSIRNIFCTYRHGSI